jgi:hypothetical protein
VYKRQVLAAALQDNDRAVIIGEKTFGKGLVQDVIELDNGNGLVMTTARYYGPSGRSIQREFSDAGNYSYFSRTNVAALIDTSSTAFKTVGNRVVFGGNGIEPDRKQVLGPPSSLDHKTLERIEDLAFAAVLGNAKNGTELTTDLQTRSDAIKTKRSSDFDALFRKRTAFYSDLAAGNQRFAEERKLTSELASLIMDSDMLLAKTFSDGEIRRSNIKKARQVTSKTGRVVRNRRN